MKQHIFRLLATANLLLALALVALWFTPQGALRNIHWQPPALQKPEFSNPAESLPALEPVNVSSFMITLDRPLFSPSRRQPPPPPPPVKTVAPEPDPLANIQLQGIYVQEGGSGGMFAKVDGKNRRIEVGGVLGAWSVKAIDNREVTFVRGDETRVLRLVPSKLATAAPVVSAAATPRTPGVPGGSAGEANAAAAPAQGDDPARTQEQERQEKQRARLELRNARRAAAGFPPVTQ